MIWCCLCCIGWVVSVHFTVFWWWVMWVFWWVADWSADICWFPLTIFRSRTVLYIWWYVHRCCNLQICVCSGTYSRGSRAFWLTNRTHPIVTIEFDFCQTTPQTIFSHWPCSCWLPPLCTSLQWQSYWICVGTSCSLWPDHRTITPISIG